MPPVHKSKRTAKPQATNVVIKTEPIDRPIKIEATETPDPDPAPATEARVTETKVTPMQVTRKPTVESISCPADGCQWTSTASNKNRALLRHLQYMVTNYDKEHKVKAAHEQAQAAIQAEKRSNPEKQKAAQVKYRMANRKKRSEATRLAFLKNKVRKGGEANETVVEQRAKDLMEAKRRNKYIRHERE